MHGYFRCIIVNLSIWLEAVVRSGSVKEVFRKIDGKTPVQDYLFNKVAGLMPATLFK